MRHVFIIGSRGLPAKYGGFETFVEQLVSHQVSKEIQYHVACLSDQTHQVHKEYQGADCFTINPPKLGPARVIAYDMMALSYALNIVKKQQIERPIFYILGNTIGAFIAPFAHQIHAVGGRLFVNPDGLEWKRSKWSRPVQAYLKYSEKLMSRHADLVVTDNEGIEAYIRESYPWSKTSYIAYGTDLLPSRLTKDSPEVRAFFDRFCLVEKGYYLVVGRFVPENNYAAIIREVMASHTRRDLVIVANHEGSAYFQELKEETGLELDKRIKFVGTVYDQELLKYLRQACRAYIHGHEVGGTNPSLLEALAHTTENVILGVGFNQKVALDTAHYWTKEPGDLAALLDSMDRQEENQALGQAAKERMATHYTWAKIVNQYEDLFLT
ncbi:glycosyl transferase [Streptococcus azizii]|uniref:Glycosyl transferase n=1 Tax=Streptococcus azizii TaxID=1579424 RepID=A0AB36JKQ5_9STRE|nr:MULTISPECIES: DUF1972 domain-containing protein [Streptococcus]MBF0776536.1 DUF1972 domain-containing protein [Streptococcus sp. 19428wD3_AN2]ONK26094.1 glycosyl transferase [Streptococcus azizii]ONK26552.1 glycosyl transferase [Streptococcus azizii]ONK27419.1 glycosyl transferase [Streptococcus azizii]TFU82883.1 glycosyltransferase family 1 protein [Streptococcus sp. AN2]